MRRLLAKRHHRDSQHGLQISQSWPSMYLTVRPGFLFVFVMQAIRLASTDARDLVPRLLQLLMVEPKGAEMLGRAVAQKAVDLPGWIWLPWIPQLMTSLQRPEVAVARRILSAAASAFPQQLYWHVRPSLLAMKDAAVKAVQDAKAQVRGARVRWPGMRRG